MKKATTILIAVSACTCLFACGSGGDKERKAENARKGKIEQLTHEMAQEGVDYVQKPIDKARALQRRAEERIDAMEEDEE